jgi:flagellar protein FlbD
MIHLTRLNQNEIVINSDLIEHIETTPDTVISLTNGQKFVVMESTADIVQRIIEFRRQLSVAPLQA